MRSSPSDPVDASSCCWGWNAKPVMFPLRTRRLSQARAQISKQVSDLETCQGSFEDLNASK